MYGIRRYGKESPGYIDGRKSRTYHCKEKGCNNEICYDTWKYGLGRCQVCSSKGKNNSFFGKKHTKKSKERMSKTTIKIFKNPKIRQKISEANKGNTWTQQCKKLQSQRIKKRFKDPKERAKCACY